MKPVDKFFYVFMTGSLGICLLIMLFSGVASIVAPKTITEHTTGLISVDAVYMHDVNRFSYTLIDENGIVDNKRPDCARTKVIVDETVVVSSYERTWKYKKQFLNSVVMDEKCFIRVKSLDYVKDSGWNYGKFGSGKTQRIQ